MTIAVVLLESDDRLARLIGQYLAKHDVQATLVVDHTQLRAAFSFARYTCLVTGPPFDEDATVRELCHRAGVAIVSTNRFSGKAVIARIRDASPVPAKP